MTLLRHRSQHLEDEADTGTRASLRYGKHGRPSWFDQFLGGRIHFNRSQTTASKLKKGLNWAIIWTLVAIITVYLVLFFVHF